MKSQNSETMSAKRIFSFWILLLISVSLFPQTPGTKKWEYLTGGQFGWYSPAIGLDGTIYTSSGDNKLHAINPDGTQKWEYFLTGPYGQSSPAIGGDGTLYIGSWDNKLYAINPNGTKKWDFLTGGAVLSSPAVSANGTIYVGSSDNKLYAINSDGTKKWEYQTPSGVYSSPSIAADGTIYFTNDKLYALNPDGSKKWENVCLSAVSQSPVIGTDGCIYVSSYSRVYAYNPDGTKKWENLISGAYQSPAIGEDGTIYFGSEDKKLYALNADGTKKWEYLTSGEVYSSPALGKDGTIYFGSEDRIFYALNADGTKKWEYLTGGGANSSPAIGEDGTIYFGSGDMKLYAIYSSSYGLANSPWPKFRHDNFNKGQFNGLVVFNTDFTNIVLPNQSFTFNINLFSSYNSNIAISNVYLNDADFGTISSLPMTVVPGVLKELPMSLSAPKNKWYKPTISFDFTEEGTNHSKEFNLEGLIFLDDSSELAHTANQVMPVWKSLDKKNEVLANNTKGLIYRLLSDFNSADSCFDIAVSMALNARYGYAGIMMNTGVIKSDQAIPDSANVFYTDALKDIQATAATSALAPQVYYNQAWEAYKKTNYTDAAGLATQTINHAKTNAYLKAKAYTLLGAIRYAQEKPSDAIDAFNQAVTLDKDGPIGQMARENLEMILGSGIDLNPVGTDIKIFPNPSNGKMVISTGNLPGNLNITVFNQTGEKVYFTQLSGPANSSRDLDLSHLVDGVYTVLIVSDNLAFTDKIVIIKN